MTDENRALVQRREFSLDRRFPCGVARVVFVRHPRIADLVIRPQLAPKALDKLAIPFVMGTRAASLNEEQLAFYAPALVSTPLRHDSPPPRRSWPEPLQIPGTYSARLP